MVVMYCYLERENYKVLNFHMNAPLLFPLHPPISPPTQSFEIK